MFGALIGGSLFGWISDRFGRRKAFILSVCLNTAIMLVTPFSPNYWTFTCLRFFVGMTSVGVIIVGVVIAMEVAESQKRELAGCCISLPDGLAEASLAAFAYYSPTWRVYLLCSSVLSIPILCFVNLMPETPRWLIANGKFEELRKLLSVAADLNKTEPNVFKENMDRLITTGDTDIEESSTSYLDFFRTKVIAKKTISSILIWVAAGMTFYGINQYTTFLGSNIFAAVIFVGFLQIPINFIAMWLNKTFGRKSSLIGTFVLTGTSMFILTFIPSNHWTAIIFGVIGMTSSCATYSIVYVYVSELFPTSLRNRANGICCAGAKVGAMMSPFIIILKPSWIPSLVFVVVALFAACVCLLLPETKGVFLRDIQ